MQFPVYRNLDMPFQVLGFSTVELIVLCFALVGGGEFTQLLGVHRIWAFMFTIVLALSLFWIRRSLGDLFGRRLIRFLKLPSELNSQVFKIGRRR